MTQPLKKKTSPRGIRFIKDDESLRLKAYKCPAGIWTVGYGHTSAAGEPEVDSTTKITEREAEDILKSDLRKYEEQVNRLVKVSLTQSQFDALVSFQFNTGGLDKSTLLKKLNEGDYNGAVGQFAVWNKMTIKDEKGKKKKVVSKGLTNRRAREAALFIEDDWEIDEEPTPQGRISRDVPAVVTPENLAMFTTATTGIGAANLESSNPIAWALAAIMFVGFVVMVFYYLKKRGS